MGKGDESFLDDAPPANDGNPRRVRRLRRFVPHCAHACLAGKLQKLGSGLDDWNLRGNRHDRSA